MNAYGSTELQENSSARSYELCQIRGSKRFHSTEYGPTLKNTMSSSCLDIISHKIITFCWYPNAWMTSDAFRCFTPFRRTWGPFDALAGGEGSRQERSWCLARELKIFLVVAENNHSRDVSLWLCSSFVFLSWKLTTDLNIHRRTPHTAEPYYCNSIIKETSGWSKDVKSSMIWKPAFMSTLTL